MSRPYKPEEQIPVESESSIDTDKAYFYENIADLLDPKNVEKYHNGENIIGSDFVDNLVLYIQDKDDEEALYSVATANPELKVRREDGQVFSFKKYLYNIDDASSTDQSMETSEKEAVARATNIKESLIDRDPTPEEKLTLAFSTIDTRSDLESYIKVSSLLENGLTEEKDDLPYNKEELLILIDGLWKGEFGIDNLPRAYGFRECVYRIMSKSLNKNGATDDLIYGKPKEIKSFNEIKSNANFKQEGDKIVYEYDNYVGKIAKIKTALNIKSYKEYKNRVKKFLGWL
jgi:hypothetical protein